VGVSELVDQKTTQMKVAEYGAPLVGDGGEQVDAARFGVAAF